MLNRPVNSVNDHLVASLGPPVASVSDSKTFVISQSMTVSILLDPFPPPILSASESQYHSGGNQVP